MSDMGWTQRQDELDKDDAYNSEARTMTPEQGTALARLCRDYQPRRVNLALSAFDLPDGWIAADLLDPGGKTGRVECGIGPEGEVRT